MRTWQFDDGGGEVRLRLVSVPAPEPGPGDALVRVRAVALNYRDLVVAKGGYQGRVPVGAVPCSDGAGEVIAVGHAVTGLCVGDRVTSTLAPDWLAGPLTREALRTTLGGGQAAGMLAEQVVLPAASLVRMAEGWTFEQSATLPCAGLTAWHALFETGACDAGTTVLTLGTGGVSLFAIQLALRAGATVIATSGSAAKLERLRQMGVSQTINYHDVPRWGDEVRKRVPGQQGVDLVVEVGGQGTLDQSLRAVRPGGTVALIGTLAGPAEVNLAPLFMRNLRLQGIFVGSREMYVRMLGALAGWQGRPVVDDIFPFDQAPAAFEHLAAGRHFGKVVVRV